MRVHTKCSEYLIERVPKSALRGMEKALGVGNTLLLE